MKINKLAKSNSLVGFKEGFMPEKNKKIVEMILKNSSDKNPDLYSVYLADDVTWNIVGCLL